MHSPDTATIYLQREAYVVLGEPCASSGPVSNALRGLKVNIVMKHIWWSLGPRLQSSKIVIIQWF